MSDEWKESEEELCEYNGKEKVHLVSNASWDKLMREKEKAKWTASNDRIYWEEG